MGAVKQICNLSVQFVRTITLKKEVTGYQEPAFNQNSCFSRVKLFSELGQVIAFNRYIMQACCWNIWFFS